MNLQSLVHAPGHVPRPLVLGAQAGGAALMSFGAFLLAQAPPIAVDHPTPVMVALGVGVAGVFAPGLIREIGEYFRRRQVRQAFVEDRQFQAQLDKIKADAVGVKADADERFRSRTLELDAIKVRATEAHGKADAAESRIAVLTGNADAAEVRATEAFGKAEAAESRIAVLTGNADAAEVRATEAHGKADAAEAHAIEAHRKADAAEVRIAALTGNAAAAEVRATTAFGKAEAAESQIAKLTADAAAAEVRAAEAYRKAEAAEAQIAALTANADAAEVRAAAALRAAAAAAAKAETTRVAIAELERVAGAARTDLAAVKADVGAATGLANAGLDANRKAGLLPPPPVEAEVPGTDWPLVLVAEDDPTVTLLLGQLLPDGGFRPVFAAKLADIDTALGLDPSILLLDLGLVDGSGEEVARRCYQHNLRARIFVTTGLDDPATHARLLGLRVEDVLVKPVDYPALIERMRRPAPRPEPTA